MTTGGTFDRLRAICDGLVDGVPTGQVAEARRRAETALAAVRAVAEDSGNPHHRRAVAGLEAILDDLDTIESDLRAVRDHAASYRSLVE